MTEATCWCAASGIQNLRAAFNRREGLAPKDFQPHRRMLGEGDGQLDAGPLKGHPGPAAGAARRLLQVDALEHHDRPTPRAVARRRARHGRTCSNGYLE